MTTVRLERVSKRFTLRQQRSHSFQEVFVNLFHPSRQPRKLQFWALRDVSFEAEAGQMLGIIGANGAGKSTILKLLTRIIEPTSGRLAVDGRVSALLELGTGFHPDLSGRENVYLNGSFVGFRKAQIDLLMDEIVDFSEMGRFIDVPVKHYSSGMYMRLGFSIAAHMRPAILLVDEVLAVGDQAFQLRCLDRIQEMRQNGVTIIFVSHDLDKVRELCDRVIWLDTGVVQKEGTPELVIEAYLAHVKADDKQSLDRAEARSEVRGSLPSQGPEGVRSWRWGSREAEIVDVRLLDGTEQEARTFTTGETLVVRIHFSAHERIERPQFGIALHHANGCHISGPNTVFSGLEIESIQGDGYIDYVIDRLPLLPGTYLISTTLHDYDGIHAYDFHDQAYRFRVNPGEAVTEKYGCILIPSAWHMGPAGFGATADSDRRPDDCEKDPL